MWTPADRALVGDFGAGLALKDDQFWLLEPLISPAKLGGRLRSPDMTLLHESARWRCSPSGGQ